MRYGVQCAGGHREAWGFLTKEEVAKVITAMDTPPGVACGPHLIVEYPDGD